MIRHQKSNRDFKTPGTVHRGELVHHYMDGRRGQKIVDHLNFGHLFTDDKMSCLIHLLSVKPIIAIFYSIIRFQNQLLNFRARITIQYFLGD